MLLNTDNKVYGKILANRLSYVIVEANLIHHSQTGFMKGHQAAENIIKILELVAHSDVQQEDNLLISYDFEKAFDTLEWESIFNALVTFNFGTSFI